MRRALRDLLDSIDPSRTIHDTQNRVDTAVGSFVQRSATVTDWEDFRDLLGQFVRHLESSALRVDSSCFGDPEYDVGRADALLRDAYGSSGTKAAFEMARTGSEGGLFAVLRSVAARVAADFTQRDVAARVSAFLDEIPLEEHEELAEEYLDEFGHLLPYELTEGSAIRIVANLERVLTEHPRLVQRLRGTLD